MKKLIGSVIELLEKGSDAVLVSVIGSTGSTPRGAGAKMLVRPDGSSLGTIGGGRVEYEAQKHAAAIYADRKSGTVGYDLAPNDVADLGMICGGKVTVYFQYMAAGDENTLALLRYLLTALDGTDSVWLVRKLRDNDVIDMGLYTQKALLFSREIDEAAILPMISSHTAITADYHVEPVVNEGTVYVFGGGHVSQQLVPVLSKVGFRVVVFEDRPEFSTPELFPTAAEIIRGDFKDIKGSGVEITPRDYVVVMTRGHQNDYDILEQTLRTGVPYVGCIGSRRKVAATTEKLLAAGVPEEMLKHMYSPIGIEIQAETPEEIAVSVTAQMILHRAQRSEG